MRRFALQNAIGERYDLNDLNWFMENPQGLGFEMDTQYRAVSGRYLPYRDKLKPTSIRGVIGFKEPDAYRKYHDFVLFLQKKPLRLEYAPDDEAYYLDCQVQALDKTELELRGLSCSIDICPLSLFYKMVVTDSSKGQVTGGKTYKYTYPYTYSSAAPGTLEISSDTTEDSPCRLIILGPVANPRWTQYVNGNVVLTGALSANIAAGRKIVVDTTSVPYKIEEQDTSGARIRNLYGSSDFSTERFVFLKKGANRISVGHEGASTALVRMEARLTYGSV